MRFSFFLNKKGDKNLLSDSDHKSYYSEKEIHLESQWKWIYLWLKQLLKARNDCIVFSVNSKKRFRVPKMFDFSTADLHASEKSGTTLHDRTLKLWSNCEVAFQIALKMKTG